jgi:hypothetical protein
MAGMFLTTEQKDTRLLFGSAPHVSRAIFPKKQKQRML